MLSGPRNQLARRQAARLARLTAASEENLAISALGRLVWRAEDWLSAPVAWVPVATDRHAEVLGGLLAKYRVTGNLVPDAHIAALAIEHGLEVCSADTDFARFTEVRWTNPLG